MDDVNDELAARRAETARNARAARIAVSSDAAVKRAIAMLRPFAQTIVIVLADPATDLLSVVVSPQDPVTLAAAPGLLVGVVQQMTERRGR